MTKEAPPTKGLVLIVDDERDLRTLLDFNLRQAGWRTAQARRPAPRRSRAWRARSSPPSSCSTSTSPNVSGADVCRLLRAEDETRGLPILMLTARGAEEDRVQGLELGADDYLPKPFSLRELVLRVEAVSRRRAAASTATAHKHIEAGLIALDLDAHLCHHVDGVELPLTLQEFRLLAYLIQGRGRVRTREELLADVWNASPELETRTVDTHVKRLRDKLGPAGDIIETVRGLGYRIRED